MCQHCNGTEQAWRTYDVIALFVGSAGRSCSSTKLLICIACPMSQIAIYPAAGKYCISPPAGNRTDVRFNLCIVAVDMNCANSLTPPRASFSRSYTLSASQTQLSMRRW